MNLYLFQGLSEDKFSSANVLVGEKVANLFHIKLGGEVAGDGGDDVAHGEAAGVELVKDLLPVALQVPPGGKLTWKDEGCCYIILLNGCQDHLTYISLME